MTTDNSFILTKDLSSLTEEERRLHMINVCEAAGLDPRAGLLKYTMMEKGDGSGERHLVLYATKGATDQLRDIHGIDIDEITDKVIGGAVVFTAKGKNKKGRRDVAVGSASIEGKRGKALEIAIMIAQTRASRRLTLQFSASGLLDESEVTGDGTVPLVDAPVPLAEVGQPVQASAEPGADITGLSLRLLSVTTTDNRETVAVESEESKRIPNPAAGLRPVPSTTMAAPDGLAPKTAATQTEVSPEAMKTRRRRRTKAEMEATRATQSSEGAVSATADAVQSPAVPTPAPPLEPPTVVVPESTSVKEAPARTVPLIGNLPNAEQMKGYVERLTKYRTEILPNAGMVPSHGMGVNKKIREFFRVANAGTDDLSKLTVGQWENTFRFMDTTVQEGGAKKLVEIIEFNIGATDEPAKSQA